MPNEIIPMDPPAGTIDVLYYMDELYTGEDLITGRDYLVGHIYGTNRLAIVLWDFDIPEMADTIALCRTQLLNFESCSMWAELDISPEECLGRSSWIRLV